jgi:para-nitrobenzyl esterase
MPDLPSSSARNLCLALAVTACALTASPSRAQGDAVRIRTGDVIGAVHEGIVAFKGIPYAAPPIGELRWRPPREPKSWKQPLKAIDYGPSCPQPLPVRRVPPGSAAERTSEDCLTLNVWTPAARTHAMPVMVWFHGGGNHDGTGSQSFYDGTSFARDAVVLVTLNYRLGALGFLAHPALTQAAGKEEPLGNYGILDQLAALHWVRKNIAAFGGDPRNVTVFGESAGGEDLLALMAAPAAAGLFSKAIVESAGGWNTLPLLADAQKMGTTLQQALSPGNTGITAAELRRLPMDALVNAPDAERLGPVVDGRLFLQPPVAVFARGKAAAIPLIIGTNGDEGSLLFEDAAPESVFGDSLSEEDLKQIRELYGPQVPDNRQFARALFRDGLFVAPTRWAAAHASGPVFVYRFDYVMSLLRGRRSGANHGSEIPFVFETGPQGRQSEADRSISETLHSCWVTFATAGIPTCTGAPAWPAYQPDRKALLEFGNRVEVEPEDDTRILQLLQTRLVLQPQ